MYFVFNIYSHKTYKIMLQLNKLNLINLLLLLFCFIDITSKNGVCGTSNSDQIQNEEPSHGNKIKNMNPKIYSNLFVRRREEHLLLYKHLMETENYEKQYKLLEIAYTNILATIKWNQKHFVSIPKLSECPTNSSVFETLTQIVENTCLFGDLLLHLPDKSYKILNKEPTWNTYINWSLNFIVTMECDIMDDTTKKMLSLLEQEINPDKRTDDYINPYAEKLKKIDVKPTEKKAKLTKKLKKGPQMTSSRKTEL